VTVDRPVRFGFVGAGWVAGRATAPAVHAAAGARLEAVAARDRERAAALRPAGRVHADYAALVADPAYQIRVRLEPGGLFIVDNRRVLHGRTAFATTSGSRHLQGCYADIDGLRSTIAVLSRNEQR